MEDGSWCQKVIFEGFVLDQYFGVSICFLHVVILSNVTPNFLMHAESDIEFFLSFWWQKLSTWIVRRRRWDTIGKVYRLFSTRRIDTIDSIRVPGTIRTSHGCGSPRGTPSWAITSASGSGAPAVSWRLPTLPVTGLPTRARQLPIAWARVRSSAGSWTRHLLHLRLHQCVNFGTVWMVIVGRTICKIKN